MKPLKTRVFEWIDSLHREILSSEDSNPPLYFPLYFKLEGFADEPEIFISPAKEGLEFGYEAIQWDGYMPSPVPGVYKKHFLTWKVLHSLNKEQQKDMILEVVMKTINTRKRQYRKCQFCGEKVAAEHRFDKDTCHGCASEHFGVVY